MTILSWSHWADEYGDRGLTVDPEQPELLDAPVCGRFSPCISPYSDQFAQELTRSPYCDRDNYPPILSFTVGDLLGTTWRNAHTGCCTVIEYLGYSRFGEPEPNFDGVMGDVGLWWDDDRFVIDHWVLVDPDDASMMADWTLFELDFRAEQFKRAQDDYEKERDSWKKSWMQGQQARYDEAKAAAVQVCEPARIAGVDAKYWGPVQIGLFGAMAA